MIPSNKQKFNKTKGKTKNFPIKQFRFDVTNSPIFKTKSRASFKIKSLLSQQEELMLKGLANSFQTDESKAFRIALSKASTIASEEFKPFLPSSLAQTKLKGHTARNRKLLISLPGEEKQSFELFASTLKLTQKAAARLVIIYTAKSIRSGTLTKIEGCRLLSQSECWDNWSKEKPVSSGKLSALKKARDTGLINKIERDDERYKTRGEMIERIIYEDGYIPTDASGKISIEYIDSCISLEQQELTNKSWELYLEELQIQNASEDEIKIENEIFHAMRIGIELTEYEAKQIIKEKESQAIEDAKFNAEEWCNDFCDARENKDYLKIAELYGEKINDLSEEEREEVRQLYEDIFGRKVTNQISASEEFRKNKRSKKRKRELEIANDILKQILDKTKELEELNKKDFDESSWFSPVLGQTKEERIEQLMNDLDELDGMRYGKYRHLFQRHSNR